jgi:hypothetical protein
LTTEERLIHAKMQINTVTFLVVAAVLSEMVAPQHGSNVEHFSQRKDG